MNGPDLSQLIGSLAKDMAFVRAVQSKQGAEIALVRATQERQTNDIEGVKDALEARSVAAAQAEEMRLAAAADSERKRSVFWWQFALSALAALLIPTLSIVWQGGRLTEHIEQLSRRVDQMSVDHESRIRAIEHNKQLEH